MRSMYAGDIKQHDDHLLPGRNCSTGARRKKVEFCNEKNFGECCLMETIRTIAAVAGCVTALSGAMAVVWQMLKKIDAICEGQRGLLRSDMLRTYYRYHGIETIRQYEDEAFLRCYAAYKALGGNSFIDKIADEIKTWEVLP